MPRKRTRPAPDDAAPAQQPGSETAAPDSSAEDTAPAGPDIFDRAIAARAAGQFERPAAAAEVSTTPAIANEGPTEKPEAAPPAVVASARTAQKPDTAHGEKKTARPPVMPKFSDTLPDPRGIDLIALEDDTKKGAQMRLLRSHKHRDVWIQFDKNPGREITDQVKAEGFRWEPRAEANERVGAWVKPLEPGREIRIMLDAERLFLNLANQIRRGNGLEPVGRAGVGAD